MGFALAHKKLWTVHLNDQNGIKFDQDKSFGSVDLRRAFNQVRVLDKHNYGTNGEWVGLDVKAMRTQKDATATLHLSNSLEMFKHLLEISRGLDDKQIRQYIDDRNYEGLDLYIMKQIMGRYN
jgi:xylose isomerase